MRRDAWSWNERERWEWKYCFNTILCALKVLLLMTRLTIVNVTVGVGNIPQENKIFSIKIKRWRFTFQNWNSRKISIWLKWAVENIIFKIYRVTWIPLTLVKKLEIKMYELLEYCNKFNVLLRVWMVFLWFLHGGQLCIRTNFVALELFFWLVGCRTF